MKWRIPAAVVLLAAGALSLFAATVRLYLKDGTFQLVKEYQVLPDRVKYLSAERDEWEEIPLDLVDLNKTKAEVAEHDESLRQEKQADVEENAALRAEREKADSVPDDAGAYYVHGDKLETVKQAEITVSHDAKRSVLKILSPIPLVPGKNTVDIQGAASPLRVEGDRPEFYIRLEDVEGFGIIKLTPKKNTRQVETVTIAAVTNELSEQRNDVATFTKQSGDQLYKIWPEKPLLPGEYAVIEFSAEQGHLLVWDFGVGPPTPVK